MFTLWMQYDMMIAMANMAPVCSKLKKLNEVNLIGNHIPVGTLGDSDSSGSLLTAVPDGSVNVAPKPLTFEGSLAMHCPELKELDGRAVKRGGDKKKGRRGSDTAGFHTW
jgi:hypothetical protein